MLKKLHILALISSLLASQTAFAQTALSTVNHSRSITTGLTFQQVLPADDTRKMLQIENNNTASTENCWVEDSGLVPAGATTATNVTTVDGVTLTAAKASLLLAPNGGSYTRYWPHLPKDPIVVTCTTAGDSVYVTIH